MADFYIANPGNSKSFSFMCATKISGRKNFKCRCLRLCSLTSATEKLDVEMVKLLLDNGYDIESKTEKSVGATSLIIASRVGHIGLVKMLLDYGADLEAKNYHGSTALHYASKRGHDEIVEILLGNGANVNSVNNYGNTPLHYALRTSQNCDVVDLLLKNEANIDIKNINGATFLGLGGNVCYVKILLTINNYINNGLNIKPAKR